SLAEKIEGGAAVFQPCVGRAHARPSRGDVQTVVQRRRRRAVLDADRRIFVTVAELDAGGVVLEFFRARAQDRRAGFFPQLSALVAVFLDLRREGRLVVETGAHFRRLVDVDHGDGLALRGIAVEQVRAAPALQHRGELPADIDGIADAGVHAEAAGRPIEVGRVSGEKDPAFLIAIGDHAVSGPGPHGKQLERNVFPQRTANLLRRVEDIELLLFDVAHVQTPQLFAVDGGDGAVDLRIDDLVLDRRTVPGVFEQRRTEQHRDVQALGKYPLIFYLQGAPDLAPAAVAADEIVRFDDFLASGCFIEDFRFDGLTGLFKRLAGCLVAGLNLRQ